MFLQLIHSFLHTVWMRPYVFLFLIAFLVIGILNRGLARTLLFLSLGFTIAFLSEVSSIRNGFPYGMYHYVYENLQNEIIFLGVPLWDSLSYSFLAYAAYEMTSFFGQNLTQKYFILAASLMMVFLDLAADPLAVQGEKWFLGKIFYYELSSHSFAVDYFGVPLTNFAGWFLVAFSIFTTYTILERKIQTPAPQKALFLGPLFYWGILAFNFLITLWIGEIRLALIGFSIHCVTTSLWFLHLRRTKSVGFHQPLSQYEQASSKSDAGF